MIKDIGLEKELIGTIITIPSSLHAVSAFLKPDNFSLPIHQTIWEAILSLETDKIDRISLKKKLIEVGKFEAVGGDEYLIDLIRCSEPSMKVVQVAEAIFDMAWKNRLAEFFGAAKKRAEDKTTSVKTLIAEAQQEFYELIQFGIKTEIATLGKTIDNVIDEKVRLSEIPKEERPIGVPTGYIDIDRALGGGMRGGDLVIFAGRPAMGKSVFGQNVALNAASKFNKKVLLITMEMSKEQISERVLAMDNKIELSVIRNSDFDDDKGNKYLQKLKSRKGSYGKVPFLIIDKSGITPIELAANARYVNNAFGLDLIVVDYVQIMDGTRPGQFSREQEIAYISTSLKRLAMELKVPILCLAQVGRQVEDRADKRPGVADLRESGSLENNADIVMFIYRDEVYDDETEDAGIAEINIEKNRNGDLARIRLLFAKEYQKFVDLERDDRTPF